jgi:hypothetical protein
MGKILSTPCTEERTPDGGVRFVPTRPIATRDTAIRTYDPPRPMFGPDDSVRSATARERGTRDGTSWRDWLPEIRTAVNESVRRLFDRERRMRACDDINEGNPPRKAYSMGLQYAAESIEPVRDRLADAVTELEAHKNYVAGVPLEAEDIAKLRAALDLAEEVINLARTYKSGAEDALKRARDAEQAPPPPKLSLGETFTPGVETSELEGCRRPGDPPQTPGVWPAAQDDAPDKEPEPGKWHARDARSRVPSGRTSFWDTSRNETFARAHANKHEAHAQAVAAFEQRTAEGARASGGSTLHAAARKHTLDSVAILKKGREEMKQQQAAPVAKARMTSAEFAALHAAKRRT